MKWEMMIVAEVLNAEEELVRKGKNYWDQHPEDKAFLEQTCKQRREMLKNKFGIGSGEMTDYAAARRKYRSSHSISTESDSVSDTIAGIIIGDIGGK